MSYKSLKIGAIFTPLEWGKFAVSKFDIFKQWVSGASVFDPTMGTGKLLESLISYGIDQGYDLKKLPVKKLYGNELNSAYYKEALYYFQKKYGLDMSGNFTNKDFLKLQPKQYDIIFGNPPWTNFVDLPDNYKQTLKPEFFKYDLIENSKKTLLGGSRIEIAALIIQRAVKDFLKRGGNSYFFMPLSLLLNEGANHYFRTYKIHEVDFAIQTVYDLTSSNAFNGIATRYGLVHLQRDEKPRFPVPYVCFENNQWKQYKAKPLFHNTDPLSILTNEDITLMDTFEPLRLKKSSKPRQGINTAGANAVYFFKSCVAMNETDYLLNDRFVLPKKYIYPLLTVKNFSQEKLIPEKWVLLPYNSKGKPLTLEQISQEKPLFDYLKLHKKRLKNRKGQMINAYINRGLWWALFGVGTYNFSKYKVVWEAYGRKTFNPMIVKGNWQVNQSLQAFIPAETLKEANKILKALQNPLIEKYLLSLRMKGTMSWAQPGTIKNLLKIEE